MTCRVDRLFVLTLGATASLGCLDPASSLVPMRETDAGAVRCWAGFAPARGGVGCEPVLPSQDCAPGTMPTVGQAACQPVGVPACAAGFALDPSGWGCVEVAATACTGATKPTLGAPGCQPVGDCARAWPPPNATHFVDAQGPVDATHFRTVQGAIAAQTTAGAVIAIGPGTYVESLQPTRAMTLVGKCAAEVVLQSPGGNTSGLRLRAAVVTLEGVTVRGHYTGAAVDSGGQLTLRDCVLDGNRELGVTVAQAGSLLTLEGCLVRGSVSANPAFGRGVQVQAGGKVVVRTSAIIANHAFGVFATDPGSSAELFEAIVAGTLADTSGAYGLGLATSAGATLSLVRSAVIGNRQFNLNFSGGTATVTDAVVRDAIARGDDGFGLIAQQGARVLIERSTFASNTQAGVGADGLGTVVTVNDSVVRANRLAGRDSTAAGARGGGALLLRGCALVDNQAMALQVVSGEGTVERSLIRGTTASPTATWEARAIEVDRACVSFTDTAVLQNDSLGMLVLDASCAVSLARTLIGQTRSNPAQRRGWGLSVQGSEVVVEDSAVFDNHEVGVFISGAGAKATVRRSAIARTRAAPDGFYGTGLLALQGTHAEVSSSDVRGSEGVGLLFDSAGGDVFESFLVDNVIALHAQRGSAIEVQLTPPTMAAPLAVVVGESTQFSGNQSRVGSGEYLVPSPF